MSAISADQLALARCVRIEDELARRGVKLREKIERTGPCPRCKGVDRFSINVRKQVWHCRQCKPLDITGDIVGFIQWCDGVGFNKAVEILTNAQPRLPLSPATPRAALARAENYERQQHRKAGWLCSRRQPIKGTIAERYLREARGIACAFPATVGFLPPYKPEHCPALIAAFGLAEEIEPSILGEPRNVNAVHLILLKLDGSGKADVEKAKITVGSPAGMPLLLAPMNDLMGLAICEGVEDALSIHAATGLGAWASGGASFLPKLVTAVEKLGAASPDAITVFVDDDDTGRSNARSLVLELAKLSAKLAGPNKQHFEILLREATK